MLGLARFAMKSPLHTGILAALFAVIPMLYLISAALVALTTLRHGLSTGTRVLVIALIGAIISWLWSGVPLSMLVLTVVTLLAVVLRESASWNRTLLVGSVIGIVFAAIAQTLFQDQFAGMLDNIQQLLSGGRTDTVEWAVIEAIRPMVGYLLMTSQLIESLLALLLARYWQAGLYNPGGLRAELHNLRFSWQEVAVLVVVAFVAYLTQPGTLMLFGIPFVFAGMALMHGVVAKLKLGGQWLVAIYIALLMFLQIIVPLLVLAVLADSVLDLRRRLPERSEPDNE